MRIARTGSRMNQQSTMRERTVRRIIPASAMTSRGPTVLVLVCAVMLAHAGNLSVRTYAVADGLANNHVSRIFRDSHNFLWMCTDEGLSRFDGLHFVNFTLADGLPDIHVNDIIETRRGEYWIGTDGGVVLFRPADHGSRFITFTPHNSGRARLGRSLSDASLGNYGDIRPN
jgi:ligand-binding sensor domain-containing protein